MTAFFQFTDGREALLAVAQAICKSRTCEGISCCQWPAQRGRTKCPVKAGAYDDAARAALEQMVRGEPPVHQPTSPSVDGREALEQIIEVANYGAKKLGEIDPAYVPGKVAGHNQNAIERFWLIVRTAKAALSAPRVEPVAWRWRYRRDEELGRWLYNDDHPGSIKGAELEIEPLYTSPPSQPDTAPEGESK